MNQRIIISTHLESEIANALTECEHDKIFILVDEVTRRKNAFRYIKDSLR